MRQEGYFHRCIYQCKDTNFKAIAADTISDLLF